ncbi:MAG: hypothetical protein NC310_03855 [Roseburia sp.]|nr:hypothetical protein [Anaeroplasma bactoclasticum]MCM1196194.1 hypothetical protein [Roseburia sp.]MCM1557274.1 hypothetical protein [Anaeroplasma bactoclasticum]
MTISKYYKPEVLCCPKCGSKLVYRHAVSKRLVYFTSGKRIRVHNLGYGCNTCRDQQIYFSQTANKLAFKGYTYSVKIICTIALLKEKNMNREEICDYFFAKNIDISDRNIDNLLKKYQECIFLDYEKRIPLAYENMIKAYGQIRLSIDLISLMGNSFVIFYDYFTSDILAFVRFEKEEDSKLYDFLSTFIKKDMNITTIVSIRRDAYFIQMLKKLCPIKTKFIAFDKF